VAIRREAETSGWRAEEEIEIGLLIDFLAVAEDLSFTKAARRLNFDQSWLSHRVRQLEARLGFNLFVRTTRKVDLTSNGRLMLEPARKLSQALGNAKEAAQRLRSALTGRLRLGALPVSFHERQRVSLIDRFMETHPETQVAVVNGPSPDLIEKLRNNSLDAAFVSAPFDDSGLDKLLLRVDGYSLLLPKEHRLASRSALRPADLAGVRIAMPSERFNPKSFAVYYRPLIEAGAIAVPVPEFQATVSYAFRWRLPALSCGRVDDAVRAAGFVSRHLEDHPHCQKYLVRLSGHQIPPLNELWKIAETTVRALPGRPDVRRSSNCKGVKPSLIKVEAA
jgi:DNA-binding transcriptional LysR family regulator